MHRIVAAMLLCVVLAPGRSPADPAPADTEGDAAAQGVRNKPVFPLRAGPGGRHLVDRDGHPFFFLGDTPWSLIVEPTQAGVETYLATRAEQGFSAVLVNLIEHKFSSDPPRLRSGIPPFATPGDFRAPVDAYFDHAEEVVRKAAEHGLAVLLCPAYLGANGGDEGFFQEELRSGPEGMRAFGRYIGGRFRPHSNVVWVLGGDFTPPPNQFWVVNELAAGIRGEDPEHLMTFHGAPGRLATSLQPVPEWLQVNTVYDYRDDLYVPCLEAARIEPARPFLMIESAYEGEHKAQPDRIRRQAYWPLLSGACGVLYGNSPLWHFGSRGVFDRGGDWVAAMHSRGAADMARLSTVFRNHPWWRLVPDVHHTLLASASDLPAGGLGDVTAARTAEGDFAMAYIPSRGVHSRTLAMDMSLFAGPVTARWFNPADGTYQAIADTPVPPSGRHKFQTPGDNGTGAGDWLLILESSTAQTSSPPKASASVRGADWPEFRGPTGQGISVASHVPIHWTSSSNIAWRAEVPGVGWSSPVLAGGRLFLTTAVGGDGGGDVSLRALCVDAADGQVSWDIDLFHPPPDRVRAIHQKNSLASPTPIVRDGRVYVHFGHMGTACLDAEGHVLWRQTGIDYPPLHGNGGSPALVGDSLVFSCDGIRDPFVIALDAATGGVRWKAQRETPARKKFSFSTPLVIQVDGQREVISPGSGFVGAYDPASGAELWRVRYGEGYSVIPRPVFAGGLLFVSSGFDSPVLYAIRPEGARGDATETHLAWSQRKGAPNTPSPVVMGDDLYMVSDAGVASCLEARTGRVHWNERLGGGFSASPVVAEGRVYFLNESGMMFVVKASRAFEVIARNDLEEQTLASPAVTEGALFVRSETHLWRIGAAR